MGKAPLNLHISLHIYGCQDPTKERIIMTTAFDFSCFCFSFRFSLKTVLRFYVTVMTEALGQKHIPVCNNAVGPEKVQLWWETLRSANATLSLYCPNPSLSLELTLRHTAKASCNLEHMEEGRKSKGERPNDAKDTAPWSGCGPIVFRVT